MVDIVVVDLGVEEGFDAGFESEFGVLDCGRDLARLRGAKGKKSTFASRFDEFGKTYAQDICRRDWSFSHDSGRSGLFMWRWGEDAEARRFSQTSTKFFSPSNLTLLAVMFQHECRFLRVSGESMSSGSLKSV